jgi:multiple antibiotic resistance protein
MTSDDLKDLGLAFIQLFVVMDPLAIVPFLAPFLGNVNRQVRRKVIRIALLTGAVVGLIFLGLGTIIFNALGISISDFLVAGGLILLVFALRELISNEPEQPAEPNELLGVVPLGTPLLVGPATISMLILLVGQQAIWTALVAFLANIAVAFVVFTQAGLVFRFLGKGGLRAVTKVVYLLLAAIAVQLIREGITDIVNDINV